MTFQAQLLKRRRKECQYSREKLADISKVSVRTIARLERDSSDVPSPRENTIQRLEKALRLQQGTLTGETPPPPAEPNIPRGGKIRIGSEVPCETRLAYDLVRNEYGVSQQALIYLAPLLFTLVAEASLDWRLRQATDAEASLTTLNDQLADHLDVKAIPDVLDEIRTEIRYEIESCEKRDVWGDDVPTMEEPAPPLFSYLASQIETLDLKRVETILVGNNLYMEKCPQYILQFPKIMELLEKSPVAFMAAFSGHARIKPTSVTVAEADRLGEVDYLLEQLTPQQIEDLESKFYSTWESWADALASANEGEEA